MSDYSENQSAPAPDDGFVTRPIHVSLTRPILLGGADRELTMINAIVIFALVFGVGLSWPTISIALFLGTIGQWALGAVTKYDTDFRRVYSRQVQLQSFYPATASFRARRPLIHASVPYSG